MNRASHHALQPRRSGNLAVMVREAFLPWQAQALRCGVRWTCEIPAWLEIHTSHQDPLREALRQLLQRAMDNMLQGGELVVTAWSSHNRVELEVADSGPSLQREERLDVARGAASGPLGKTVRALRRLGGDMTALNCSEGGAAFTLHIPAPVARAAA